MDAQKIARKECFAFAIFAREALDQCFHNNSIQAGFIIMNQIATILLSFEIWCVILCLIAGICVYVNRRHDTRGAEIIISLLVVDILMCLSEISGILWRAYMYERSASMIGLLRFVTLSLSLLLIATFGYFIDYILKKYDVRTNRIYSILVYGGCFCGFALLLIFYIFVYDGADDQRIYGHGYLTEVYFFVLFFCMTVIFFRLLSNRKSLRQAIFTGLAEIVIIPILGALLKLFDYGVYFVNIASIISFVTLLAIYEINFGNILLEKELKMHSEQQALLQKEIEFGLDREKLLKDQLRLEQEQINIYNHQIQPHFIFNTLTAIRSKCEEGSEARDGIDAFATYLRGCVDMLTKTECVPMEREITVVDSYLEISELRLGNKIKIIRNIEETDFYVPPFAIQSIVENAVRHGIRNKPDRTGTIRISVYKSESGHIVEIQDDGVGFDTGIIEKEDERGRSHIGLANTVRRVETMCRGRVKIESIPGTGTTVKMYFPVKEA